MRILLTGGGTGGHLFPLIAVARHLKKIETNLEFLFIGPNHFGQETLYDEGIPSKIIFSGKLRRYASLKTISDIFSFGLGFIQALWHVFIFMPDVIFSKGGYGSMPVILAGWLYRIPILIHESDSIPGLSNRLAGKFAQKIALSFEETLKYFPPRKTALIGNPIREEILNGSKEEAKNIFQLSSERKIILILGGSQGARNINKNIYQILNQLLTKYEIIHQCGRQNYQEMREKTKNLPYYHLIDFLDENQLKNAYAAANLIISRAGAGTITEISALGKPSILIPLTGSAANHQTKNAYEYAKSGATIVLEEPNLMAHLFFGRIDQLLSNDELLQKMSQHAREFHRPKASQKIAEELLKLGEK